MTLIERYLRAVRDTLPRDGQDDIIDELADNLQSRMEDEAAARGRPLDEEEQVAILKTFGHPLSVAARYRGDERTVTFGRQLIGPELFPIYLKVLAVNVIVTLLVAAIAFVAGGAMGLGFPGIFVPLTIQFVAVTVIFIAIDRHWVRDPDGWDPRTVNAMGPDVDVSSLDGIADQMLGRARPRKGLTTALLELGFGALILALWLSIGVPTGGTVLEAGPGWAWVFAPAAVVLTFSLVPALITILRPAAVRLRVAANIAVDVAVTVVSMISLAIGQWVVVVAAPVDPVGAAELAELVNTIVRVSLAATIVLTVIRIAFEVRRYVRLGRADVPA
jgi:hypothetical protein